MHTNELENYKRTNEHQFTGDHGFRGAGEAQTHRMYGVCVTYPKVVHVTTTTPSAAQTAPAGAEESAMPGDGLTKIGGLIAGTGKRRRGGGVREDESEPADVQVRIGQRFCTTSHTSTERESDLSYMDNRVWSLQGIDRVFSRPLYPRFTEAIDGSSSEKRHLPAERVFLL